MKVNMRKFLVAVLVSTAGVLSIGGSPSAVAATVTITSGSCSNFAVTQSSSGNLSINCQTNAALSCSLTPSSSSVTIGSPVSLTASCSGGSGSYTYSSVSSDSSNSTSCPSPQVIAGSPAVASAFAAANCVYDVTGNDGTSSAVGKSTGITWSAGATVTAPSGCTVTPASSTVNSGATVQLNVNCSGGSTPTSYQWYAGGAAVTGQNSATYTFNASASNTYYATASNSGGTSSPSSGATITVNSASSGGGGNNNVGAGSCPAGYWDILAQAGTSVSTFQTASYIVPANGNSFVAMWSFIMDSTTGLYSVSSAEYSTNSSRLMVLSSSPCGPALNASSIYGTSLSSSSGSTATIRFTANNGNYFASAGYEALTPGQTYYITVYQTDRNGTATCNSGNCTFIFNP